MGTNDNKMYEQHIFVFSAVPHNATQHSTTAVYKIKKARQGSHLGDEA